MEGEASRTADLARAVFTAAGWLVQRHPQACREAIEEGYFGALDADSRELIDELPKHIREMVDFNSIEWLVAEGELVLGEGEDAMPVRASRLVLGLGGPLLLPEPRTQLEAMCAR